MEEWLSSLFRVCRSDSKDHLIAVDSSLIVVSNVLIHRWWEFFDGLFYHISLFRLAWSTEIFQPDFLDVFSSLSSDWRSSNWCDRHLVCLWFESDKTDLLKDVVLTHIHLRRWLLSSDKWVSILEKANTENSSSPCQVDPVQSIYLNFLSF